MDSIDTKLDRRNFIRTLAAAGVAAGTLTLEGASAEAASCPKLPKTKSSKEIVPVHIVSEVGDVIDGEMDLRTVELAVMADGSRSLSVELFFDGFEEGTDVHGSTDAVLKLALVHQELHRPPTAILTWGKGLSFKCMVQSGRAGFTLFLDDGTPVRAIVRVQLQVFDDCTLGTP